MEKEQLTMADMLKFMRHDFLNELQLILMHIDLGNPSGAKQTVLNATEKMNQHSKLSALGMPALEKWITTFEWVYNAFQTTLVCDIKSGNREVDDAEIVSYLDQLFSDVVQKLDPAAEYTTDIDVQATSVEWKVVITVNGPMDQKIQIPETTGSFLVEETVSHNFWTFTISGQ